MRGIKLTELIPIVLLLLALLGLYILQFLFLDQSQNEAIALYFRIAESKLYIALGWGIQHLYSRIQFTEELKRYGYSAFRRISDIGSALGRLKKELINQELTNENKNKNSSIDLGIDLVNASVDSAILDWADVIGEEIKISNKIQEVENQIAAFKTTSEKDAEIIRLKDELEVLKAQLPEYWATMQMDRPIWLYDKISNIVDEFRREYKEKGKIKLLIGTSELKPTTIARLKNGDALFMFQYGGMHSRGAAFTFEDEPGLGELVNKYAGYGVHDIEYIESLLAFIREEKLPIIEGRVAFDDPFIRVKYEGFTDSNHYEVSYPVAE